MLRPAARGARTGYAEPAQVFDNLYFVGTRNHGAWAVTTPAGILDYTVNPARHSSGPIVADGKAFSGRSCRPWAGPEACVIVAHDAETGDELWRRRLVPAPGERGDETWGDVPYEDRVHVGSWTAPASTST